jgi:hypothetical protein
MVRLLSRGGLLGVESGPRAPNVSAALAAFHRGRVPIWGRESYETVNVSGVAGEPLLSGATVTMRVITPMPESVAA